MATSTEPATGLACTLAYTTEGSGPPVVLLPGLTFDRRVWRPVIELLGGTVTSVCVDLSAHGGSPGPPQRLETVAARLHRLVDFLGLERPVVVGHSMSAAVAGIYAATYPTRGIVFVDQATEILPFATMLRQLAPMLRGPGFAQVWPRIEAGLGLDLLPEPTRSLVRQAHRVDQDVVLGYWDQVLTTDPAELQAWIDGLAARIETPCLALFGRAATPGERERLARLPDARIVEWPGDGHFAHLVDAGRFTDVVRAFVARCAP